MVQAIPVQTQPKGVDMRIILVTRRLYAVVSSTGKVVKTGTFGECYDHANA